LSRSLIINVFWMAFGILAAATIIGLVTLWPRGPSVERPGSLVRPKTVKAEVEAIRAQRCTIPGQRECRRVTARVTEGDSEGTIAAFTVLEPTDRLKISVGDTVRLSENQLPPEAQLGGVKVDRWALADFERRTPLLLLGLAFALLVMVTGRWKGLRALIGLAISLAVVVKFIVPALLAGESPAGTALVGSLAIMLATLLITHGGGVKMLAASLGTGAALLIALGLGSFFIDAAHITGLASEEAVYLRATVGEISVSGLLLAGLVIAALGVLDDLTVSQASTVLALRRANPALGFSGLFREAIAVGHDHVAATVNTLVLAYAGASLPVLLIFSLGDTTFSDALNSESVAVEIIATLVGSVGLIAAVPLTTALAAVLASQMTPEQLPPEHAHAHAH
jgi:uncharacterized membrane protein